MGDIYINNEEYENSSANIVFCRDLKGLVQFVADHRSIEEYHIKIGMDSGEKSWKITLSIQSHDEYEKQAKVNEKFKDTGVKKIFIIALLS